MGFDAGIKFKGESLSKSDRSNNGTFSSSPYPMTLSSELLAVHNFFLSRRHADAFWDKTLILSQEKARKVSQEYIQAYGDSYSVVVQVDCFNVGH